MSIKKFLNLFLKNLCIGCRTPAELNRYGFCPSCERKVVFIENPPDSQNLHILRYEGPVKDAICGFKYNRKTYYGKRFALLVYDFIRDNKLESFDAIVPVPLHWKKEFRRGYNQSAIVSINLASLLKKECLCGVLVKVKNTVSQTELSESERKKNVKDAFSVRRAGLIEKKKILLFDDVYTSGATTAEAKKTLLAAGARSVIVLTLSRA